MTNKLVLYSRRYCHLCDDMLAALEHLRGEFDFEVTVIDVDTDPALVAMYNERVPVLATAERELCRYHLEPAKVREYLAGKR